MISSQTVISLELLTVLVVAPLACLVCYDIAKKNPRANVLMTVIATAELYGGASRPRDTCGTNDADDASQAS